MVVRALFAIALVLAVPAPAAGAGLLDRSFSENGLATAAFQDERELGFRAGAELAVTGDGKIIVALASRKTDRRPNDVEVFGFTRDGRLDRTFAGDGRALVRVPGDHDDVVGVGVRSDGTISMGVTSGGRGTSIVQLRSNGQLDGSFGDNGRSTPIRGLGVATAFELDSRGRTLMTTGSDSGLGAARLTTRGKLDPSFGTGGITEVDLTETGETVSRTALAKDLALTRDGSVILVGTTEYTRLPYGPSMSGGAVAKLTANGDVDSTFSDDGHLLLGPEAGAVPRRPSDGPANSVAVRDDGSIVVAGIADENFAFTSLSVDGSLQTPFGGDGTALLKGSGKHGGLADALALDRFGNALFTGSVGGPPSRDYAVAAVTRTGSPLPGFGQGGVARIVFSERWDDADSIEVLPSGKILVAGTVAADRIGLALLR